MTEDTLSVGIVKIEVDSRYLFVFHYEKPATRDTIERIRESAKTAINGWWDSGNKFGFVVLDGGIKLHLERIDPNG